MQIGILKIISLFILINQERVIKMESSIFHSLLTMMPYTNDTIVLEKLDASDLFSLLANAMHDYFQGMQWNVFY